jgi:hypothetical protein
MTLDFQDPVSLKRDRVGTKRLVNYAFEYLNAFDYRQPDGTCRLCGQVKITGRHNCNALREIATKRAEEIVAAVETMQAACSHAGRLTPISHEESRCPKCGAFIFLPDD